MNFLSFKSNLHKDLEFQKASVTSRILSIDEDGVQYSIGKNGHSKKVTFEVFQAAFNELQKSNQISRQWFKETFPMIAKTAPCNFTTIGGLFQHFGLAKYEKRGIYTKTNDKEQSR